MQELPPGPTAVLTYELGLLNSDERAKIQAAGGPGTELSPAVWYYRFDGGHTGVTMLGHAGTEDDDPLFVNHLYQGIQYVVSQVKLLGPARAYTKTPHDPIP